MAASDENGVKNFRYSICNRSIPTRPITNYFGAGPITLYGLQPIHVRYLRDVHNWLSRAPRSRAEDWAHASNPAAVRNLRARPMRKSAATKASHRNVCAGEINNTTSESRRRFAENHGLPVRRLS